MERTRPPKVTTVFTAPSGLDESQVGSIDACVGTVPTGSNLEGAQFVVVAWKPSPEDLEWLQKGGSIFLSVLGSLPPHFLSTTFREATYGIQSD